MGSHLACWFVMLGHFNISGYEILQCVSSLELAGDPSLLLQFLVCLPVPSPASFLALNSP